MISQPCSRGMLTGYLGIPRLPPAEARCHPRQPPQNFVGGRGCRPLHAPQIVAEGCRHPRPHRRTSRGAAAPRPRTSFRRGLPLHAPYELRWVCRPPHTLQTSLLFLVILLLKRGATPMNYGTTAMMLQQGVATMLCKVPPLATCTRTGGSRKAGCTPTAGPATQSHQTKQTNTSMQRDGSDTQHAEGDGSWQGAGRQLNRRIRQNQARPQKTGQGYAAARRLGRQAPLKQGAPPSGARFLLPSHLGRRRRRQRLHRLRMPRAHPLPRPLQERERRAGAPPGRRRPRAPCCSDWPRPQP